VLRIALSLLLIVACGDSNSATNNELTLLNVSYDPTRELYAELNVAFAKAYRTKTGVAVKIKQSHGGSGKQARSVIDGLEADVVSLALAGDIDAIAAKGLIDPGWQSSLPDRSSPYTSTIVFLVRKGNPKGVKDWDDLIKPDTKVIIGNPKTSGGSRWSYLAAWAHAKRKLGSDEAATGWMKQLFANVPVLDSGARGTTTTFAERGIGDVLVQWENDAHLLLVKGGDKYELVSPQRSILAEPPVAIVTRHATKHGTTEVAKAYLEFLFTAEGQAIIGKHHYRPRATSAITDAGKGKIELFTIDELGGWTAANTTHFADGGTFDKIYGK
jgi:sulfate/thiosulfate transport system substrate-binding protein